MAIFIREEMVGKLQQGECEVFFKKKNGAVRHMMCTLNPKLAPSIEETRVGGASLGPPDSPVISVWDIEKSAWRSFRTDSVLVFNERDDS
jgi:hypothetical protein